jgi:hypothetical protein
MKHLLLERPKGLATDTETQGFLSFARHVVATIEQEWRDGGVDNPGGEPFNSCVPNGKYKLIPHTRPDDKIVMALINEDLGVYYLKEDRVDNVGRYLILMHIANWAEDVVGCIGPGTGKVDSNKGPMVTSSKAAMKKIMDYIDGDDAVLEIRWV